MSKDVRVGVIGLGMIAERAHLPNFAAARSAKLCAVSSSRPAAARAACVRYGIETAYGDWRELVRSDALDAVAVCAPNDVHAEITLEALKHGKHVLVEKPMATRALDAARMVATARAERRVLDVHHNLRFHPVAMAARAVLRRGTIGRVIGFEGLLSHRGPKAWAPRAKWFFDPVRVGGGVLMDLGVHASDLLNYFVDSRAERIAAVSVGAARASGGDAEHQAHCLVSLTNGASGTVSVGWRDSTYRNHWYFTGERAALELDFRGAGALTLHSRQGSKSLPLGSERAQSTAQQAFVDRIRGRSSGAVRASATGEDGRYALMLALAALHAGRSQASVRLQRAARKRS